MTEGQKNIDYYRLGKVLWHQGLGEALKVIAEGTENRWDDEIIKIVDKIAESVFPVEEESKKEVQ